MTYITIVLLFVCLFFVVVFFFGGGGGGELRNTCGLYFLEMIMKFVSTNGFSFC